MKLSRTTFEIPADIHKKFKARTGKLGKSMKDVVIQLMLDYITECKEGHVPNKKLSKAIENVRQRKNLVHTKDLKDALKKLKS